MHKAPVFFTLAVSLAALSLQAATLTVTNGNASGPGSLAQAMADANRLPNSNIVFDLPGPPPYTIDIFTPLPAVTVPVSINATTQIGYIDTPVVTLANHLRCAAGPCAALDLRSTLSTGTVVGLRFLLDEGPGVVSSGPSIAGCRFERSGAPSDAETAAVRIVNAHGTELSSSTVSFGTGVEIINSTLAGVSSDTFTDCYRSAVVVKGSSKMRFGEFSFPSVIGRSIAAGQPAVSIDAASSSNIIERIVIANAAAGIDIAGNDNRVRSCIVHDVDAWAIRMRGQRNRVDDDNSIYNVGAGAANGIVLADGGNANLPPPVITSAAVTPSGTTITATTSSGADEIDYFVSDSCGVPAGRWGLGFATGVNPAGTFHAPVIRPGWFVTAVQSRSNAGSSPFSACVAATGSAAGPAPSITSVDPTPYLAGGSVRISGANFASTARIFLGSAEATRCSTGPSVADCTIPPGSGTVDVAIENPDGQRAVKNAAFTYLDPCPPIRFNFRTPDVPITGKPVTLSVIASSALPLTYQWYNEGVAIAGETRSSITVTPKFPTTYVVRATSSCGSTDAGISAFACVSSPLRITVQPADTSPPAGQQAALCVDYAGFTGSIQWYEGPVGNLTRPVPDGAGACAHVDVTKATTYWARITNGCGSIDSRAATVVPARRRAVRP